MRRQTASALGLLAVLLGFIIVFVAFAISSWGICPSGEAPAYCSLPYANAMLGNEVAILGGMTVLLGVVVLALSRSIPLAPRQVGPPVPAEPPAEFEDLWVDSPDRSGSSR